AGRGSALETLELRYARGEIEREEYLQKRQDLTS
ncbi:MAG: SHOCT domain-containing protein, partial [Gemmatimonadetes bacterium]|nr:SHOCT domain-containing protein [Gemmatimonadota bacterium]NIQ56147.1 SHOCT domain-containing protein [Gemmatimonadota bacterium]NIU76336.1 SHOCT domain-containing protein [Gammaproteobacteria bacterium]NIX45829.1 SHOCT domain-containing protein [Gemmatimonadota bacterium]